MNLYIKAHSYKEEVFIFRPRKYLRTAADFRRATFDRAALFTDADFLGLADFRGTTFVGFAKFSGACFTEEADFREAKFLGPVEFRESKFRGGMGGVPEPVFSLAQFERPEEVIFYKTYLGWALFHNCDVSKFVFSDVSWRERKGTRRFMVFDEEVELAEEAAALTTKPADADERNYCLIAELYQRLKKNYDDRRDYWTAGDFHYGEMEMKRLSSRRKFPILRWLHRYCGLLAWYKYFSEYGESYARPAALLLFFLLVPSPRFIP